MQSFVVPTIDIRRSRLATATLLALVILIASAMASAFGAVRAVPIGNFLSPVHVATAPGQSTLLLIVERQGTIRVMRSEVLTAQPFLDIRHLVLGPPDPAAGGEQGLLSVAFAPDFPQSRRFYVFFTAAGRTLEIDEFRVFPNNVLRANPATRRVVLRIPHPDARNHNGGQLQFDANGLLYISTGDGGTSPIGDNARNLNSLLGKILRINPLRLGASPYRIPSQNPFVGRPGRDEIFAYGLRNPWRFTLDGARITIGDVGASRQEEANLTAIASARGANFGWPQYEGRLLHDSSRPGPHPPKFPSFVYGHNTGGCAIVGGYVVRDPGLPELAGRYVYGDSCTGQVRTFDPRMPAATDRPTGIVVPGLSSFGVGFNRQLYLVQLSGGVFRVEPTP